MAGSLENRGKLRELIDKFQFVGMIKIPISRVKGLVINMNVGNRLLLVKYKERRKMELSENMLGNGRYVVKFGG